MNYADLNKQKHANAPNRALRMSKDYQETGQTIDKSSTIKSWS